MKVSPLYLLLPLDAQKRPGQPFLLDTWKAIGSVDPPADVVTAEKEIWRILFEAATGGDLNSLVREAVKTLNDSKASGTWPLVPITNGSSSQPQQASSAPLSLLQSSALVKHPDSASSSRPSDFDRGLPEASRRLSSVAVDVYPSNAHLRDPSTRQDHKTAATPAPPILFPDGGLATALMDKMSVDDELAVRSPLSEPPLSPERLSLVESEVSSGGNSTQPLDLLGGPQQKPCKPNTPGEADKQKLLAAKRRRAAAAARKKALEEAALSEASKKEQLPRRELRRLLFKIPSWAEVIDLTKDEEPMSLKIGALEWKGAAVQKVYGNTLSIPIAGSNSLYTFTPEFHFDHELEWFKQLMHDATQSYVDGLPRYISRPESSRIAVLNEKAYLELSDEALAILKDRHLLIVGRMDQKHEFKPDCFRLLGTLERQVTIQDFSISTQRSRQNSSTDVESEDESEDEDEPDVEEDPTLRHTRGYPLDLYYSRTVRSTHEQRASKSLNCLDFPINKEIFDPLPPFASASVAWDEVEGSTFCMPSDHFPFRDVRWGIAGTTGAYHKFHADTDGYMTLIQVETGFKLWFILTPKAGRSFKDFADINVFLDLHDRHRIDTERYDLEVVVLTSTMWLAMRPNTLHAVYTPSDAICRGGHFYPISTIRDSIYGIYHTFVASEFVTNADHWNVSQMMLTWLLALIHRNTLLPSLSGVDRSNLHIPDFDSWEGILDQLCLHNLFELGNVLNYTHGADDARGRKRAITNRQRSRQVIDWIFSHIQFKSTTKQGAAKALSRTEAKATLCHAFLAHQARALVLYKQRAEERKLRGTDPLVNASKVGYLVRRALAGEALEYYLRLQSVEVETFAWPAYEMLEDDGMTPDDEDYIRQQSDYATQDETEADGAVDVGGDLRLILRPTNFTLVAVSSVKTEHDERNIPLTAQRTSKLKRVRSQSTTFTASTANVDPESPESGGLVLETLSFILGDTLGASWTLLAACRPSLSLGEHLELKEKNL
ncbi:hypothetical protein DXG01_011053 [Tephrocybe rancida]|nr:hypothetical protein DXG01_011053 [Tephrocybe rancida]